MSEKSPKKAADAATATAESTAAAANATTTAVKNADGSAAADESTATTEEAERKAVAASPSTPAKGTQAAPCPHTAACAICAAGMEGTPEMPDEELLYDLADLFKTFGDTTRIKILYALMGRELCVADLAELIGATQSAVSHQLRTLKQARLVKFQRDGKNVIYSLSDDHVFTMIAQGMTHICE